MKFACKKCGQRYEVEECYLEKVFPLNCNCGNVIEFKNGFDFHFYLFCYWFCYFTVFSSILLSIIFENIFCFLYGIMSAFVLYVIGYFAEQSYFIRKSNENKNEYNKNN